MRPYYNSSVVIIIEKERIMKSRIVKRTLALASCLFMLAGEVMPAYAAGTADDGQITEVVTEEDNAENEENSESEDEAVSENDAEEKEDTVSDNDTISDNEAVSENEAVGDENTEDDNEDETPGDEETVSAAKPSGNPVATAALGDNVTGSIYKDGAKVILYVDGRGNSMNTEFKESTLSGYPITDVIFGGEVSKLYDGAFADVTSIQRVVFSGDITYIAHESFMGCTSLTSLTFEKGSGHLDICDKAFKGCTRLNNVTIPKRVGKQVGSGGEYYGVFSECSSLTNAALEDGITLVPANTFVGASALTNISIPSSVTAIGDGAFEACSSLKAFTFPANVKSIGESAFAGTAFSSFIIPGTVTAIGSWAFEDCRELTLSPVYKQKQNWFADFNYIDYISTGSGSWSNLDAVYSYKHTFRDPSEKSPSLTEGKYDFRFWKNEASVDKATGNVH